MEKLKCPLYKISSFEMTDFPLIKRVAKTKKPIIISTGMANLKEIEETYKFAKKNGAKDITLLYCVSNYPSKIEDFNLNNIKILKKKFNCKVGLSDHSKGNLVASLAVSQGAEIFEKHIALDGQKKGVDIEFSIKGKEIQNYKDSINNAHILLKKKFFFRNKSEDKSKQFRRSLFVVQNIKKGDKFSQKNIKRIRPGNGISPIFYEKILGKKSPQSLFAGDPLTNKILKSLNIR